MKSIYSVLAILSALIIVGMVTSIGSQKASAFGFVERQEFKKLTHDFEKDVLDAAIGNPEIIPGLVEDYKDNVLELFRTSTSP